MQVNPTQYTVNTESADKLEKWHIKQSKDRSTKPRQQIGYKTLR